MNHSLILIGSTKKLGKGYVLVNPWCGREGKMPYYVRCIHSRKDVDTTMSKTLRLRECETLLNVVPAPESDFVKKWRVMV
jgi:hypothetical protein